MERFFKKYKIRAEDIDMGQLVRAFITEMEKGLAGSGSSLKMIPTYIEADNEFKTGVPVTAIDAGGTNFRAANVVLTDEGGITISGRVKEKMPGSAGEVSKEQFFNEIAGYVKHLASETEQIGFCFSYPTDTRANRDGKLLQFSKEIQAPDVIGELIGQNLLNTLHMPDKRIVLLNDTVATLLAGKSASLLKTYDSYIGFILGTGTNCCYIENNRNITKIRELDRDKSQAINIESGNFAKAPRTEIDLKFDATTNNPGGYTFEKMISGAYFGKMACTALKTAADEGVFSDEAAERMNAIENTETREINRFMDESQSGQNPLDSVFEQKSDRNAALQILYALVSRAAKLAAAHLAAVILKTGKGKKSDAPILITVEGSAYYGLFGLRPQIKNELKNFLSGDNKRYYEFTKVDQSSLVGAALAALTSY